MSNWTFWDWTGYSTIFLSALIIAGIQWGMDLNFPSWVYYMPLLLIIVGTLIFIFREIGWIDKRDSNITTFPIAYEYKMVRNEKYMNESILLDGHRYENCRFTNVTFIWNGSAPFELINCDREGAFRLTSRNDVINTTLNLLEGFQFLGNISSNPDLHDLLRVDTIKIKP